MQSKPLDKAEIILLSGLPCSGKTTLSNSYANNYKDAYTACSNAKTNEGQISSTTPSIFQQIELLKNEVNYQTTLISKAVIDRKKIIVMDRGFNDILCFTEYYYKEKNIYGLNFWNKNIYNIISHHSLNIYIDVPSKILKERNKFRKKNIYGRGLSNIDEYFTFYETWFRAKKNIQVLSIGYDAIDNSVKELDKLIRNFVKHN